MWLIQDQQYVDSLIDFHLPTLYSITVKDMYTLFI